MSPEKPTETASPLGADEADELNSTSLVVITDGRNQRERPGFWRSVDETLNQILQSFI